MLTAIFLLPDNGFEITHVPRQSFGCRGFLFFEFQEPVYENNKKSGVAVSSVDQIVGKRSCQTDQRAVRAIAGLMRNERTSTEAA